MRIDTPDGYVETEFSKAEIKKGFVIIDGKFMMGYSEYTYKLFCMQTYCYVQVIDMLPESMDTKPILNDESLLAFAVWNKAKWESISDKINFHKANINLLESLK